MALSPENAKRAHLVFNRFGLGSKQGSLTDAIASDPRTALLHELNAPEALLIRDENLLTTKAALTKSFEEQREVNLARQSNRDNVREMLVARGRMQKQNVAAPSEMATDAAKTDPSMIQAPMAVMPQQSTAPAAPQIEQVIFRNEAMARIKKATEPEIGFGERLVLFWSNHFCVSVQKGQLVRATAGALEREAIRPFVLGKFSDMLLAVEKHPAMLEYLDNRQSVGPASPAGRNRKLGLNENLAREILELHTLGVNGGYSQVDVTSLAKIITGWTFAGMTERLGSAGEFAFTPNRHEPGEQAVLGHRYSDSGVMQGEKALQDLARHPSTAKHIAAKLVRHFISDEQPPAAIIDHLAKTFRDTDGDLKEVSKALINHDDAWKNASMVKMRTPYEWLSAIARFGAPPRDFGQLLQPLTVMGAPLWAVPGPNGFPDTASHWGSPESLRARLDLSAVIGRRFGDRFNPSDLADELFNKALSTETAQAIRRAESKHQGLAILLMSPEFQRR
jgi:uncharacterized protein (DUF1800 family)